MGCFMMVRKVVAAIIYKSIALIALSSCYSYIKIQILRFSGAFTKPGLWTGLDRGGLMLFFLPTESLALAPYSYNFTLRFYQ